MATPTTDPCFLLEAEEMIKTRGEILAEFRYSRAAGSRDIALFHSFLSFQEHIATLPPPTRVEVYRRYDLPLRGVIDEAMTRGGLRSTIKRSAGSVASKTMRERKNWKRICGTRLVNRPPSALTRNGARAMTMFSGPLSQMPTA